MILTLRWNFLPSRYYEENGQPNLDNIDSDEEYEIAADAFDELMDTEQFNEMEENSTEE